MAAVRPKRPKPRRKPHKIQAGGRSLTTTEVYDTYWRFAAERQAIYMRRLSGAPPPWTQDDILAGHRFTNVYRAADRVSQYLIRRVIYCQDPALHSPQEVFFRTLLFKSFNKIETWQWLRDELGQEPSWAGFDLARYNGALERYKEGGAKLYSAAYILANPRSAALGKPDKRKHYNHLRLLQHMMQDGAPRKIAAANSLEQVYEALRGYPSIGGFLAFQYAIDLNYSEAVNFSEMDFVVAGPGALRGIQKCFADTQGATPAQIIGAMARNAEAEFDRLGLQFQSLWGRPLQLIDCQNIFCETDKYARVKHPEIRAAGAAKGSRIKQKYRPPADDADSDSGAGAGRAGSDEGAGAAGDGGSDGNGGEGNMELDLQAAPDERAPLPYFPPKWKLDIASPRK